MQGQTIPWGLWEHLGHMALRRAYLSAGLSSVKEKGIMLKSNATRDSMPKELEVQNSAVGGTVDNISPYPPFTEEKMEA